MQTCADAVAVTHARAIAQATVVRSHLMAASTTKRPEPWTRAVRCAISCHAAKAAWGHRVNRRWSAVRDEVDDGEDRDRDAQEPRKTVLHRIVPFGERSNDLLLAEDYSKARAAPVSAGFCGNRGLSTSYFSATQHVRWCT